MSARASRFHGLSVARTARGAAGRERRSALERLTVIRSYEELRGLGYEGSYAAVRRYAIAWRQRRTSATVNAFIC
jgi:hypothetical protein